MDWSIAIIVWIVCGIAALLIAQNRGASNAVTWFLVGVLLGPLGVILAVIGAKPPKPKHDPAMVTLAALAEQRRLGNVTTEEYESKKAELLARM